MRYRWILALLGLSVVSAHDDGYCKKYDDFFKVFCLSRTQTTETNDQDSENFCPRYAQLCKVSLAPNPDRYVVERTTTTPRPLNVPEYCRAETYAPGVTLDSDRRFYWNCRRFPRTSRAFYNTCHSFLLYCGPYFEDGSVMQQAALRASQSPALQINNLADQATSEFNEYRPKYSGQRSYLETLALTEQASRSGNFQRSYEDLGLANDFLGRPQVSPVQAAYLTQRALNAQTAPGVPNVGSVVPWAEQFSNPNPSGIWTDLNGKIRQGNDFISLGNIVQGIPFVGRRYPYFDPVKRDN